MTSSGSHKNKWTASEDAALVDAVKKLGTKSWKDVSFLVPGRTGKQCRERYTGQLAPSISKDIWTTEEDEALIAAQKIHGNRWALISKMLTGRSSISVKNRWGWILRHRMANKTQEESSFNPNKTNQTSSQIEKENCSGHHYFVPLEVPNSSLFGPDFVQFQKALLV